MSAVEPYYVDVRELDEDNTGEWKRISGSTDVATALAIADAVRNFSYLYGGNFEMKVTNTADLNISV